MKLTASQIQSIRELRYEDGLTCLAVARLTSFHVTTIQRHAPGRPGKINNAKLREAFLASGLTAGQVARRMGWEHSKSRGPDTPRIKRTLGLLDEVNGRKFRSTRTLIDAETATLLADAIGIAPGEIGA